MQQTITDKGLTDKKIYFSLFYLILFSTLIRGFLAAYLELGNDEVYYWTYALYPDLSHFDHPPMVGYMIQAFTLNLIFDHEFFLRLPSILLGAVNTWLIFLIGKRMKDGITGFYAAVLYTASVYCFIIAGIFILPDTPQLLFWLLSIYFLITSVTRTIIITPVKSNLILAGLTIGLAMLSKYTSVFLWIGAFAYIILYNRRWLKQKELYVSVLVSVIIFLPVLIWNIQNDFISFTYQSERVNLFDSGIRLDYFFRELGGQILYNNPVNWVLIVIALLALARGTKVLSKACTRFLLWVSLPLIFIFLAFSLFRGTLPHWTGPAYLGLMLIAAAYFRKRLSARPRLMPLQLQLPLYFLAIILILGVGQVKFGLLYQPQSDDPTRLGKDDVSLDMYGWRQLSKKFTPIYREDILNREMGPKPIILSYRWFPAANLDYYVACPNRTKVFAIGSLDRIHKYWWINEIRGGFKKGMDAYFITSSRDYHDPYELYNEYFETIIPRDTIHIYRSGEVVKNVFIYQMKSMK